MKHFKCIVGIVAFTAALWVNAVEDKRSTTFVVFDELVKETTLTLTALASPLSEPPSISMELGGEQADLSVEVGYLPAELGVFFDTSVVCAQKNMEAVFRKWMAELPAHLASRSRVSVLTYAKGSLEVLARQVSATSAAIVGIECQQQALSTSPDEAIERWLKITEGTSLARHLILITSGNVRIQEATLKKLAETNTSMEIDVYNPALFPAIQTGIQAIKQANPRPVIARAMDAQTRPLALYSLVTHPPAEVAGSVSAVTLEWADTQVVRQISFPEGFGKSAPWTYWLFWAAAALAILALLRGLYLLVMPRRCPQGHRLRRRDTVCWHCPPSAAVLIGRFNTVQASKVGKLDVVPVQDELELGSHRRSAVSLVRPQGKRRASFLRIRKLGHRVFLLEPMETKMATSLAINGRPLTGPRILASGDCLRINEATMEFYLPKETAK